MRTKTLLLSAAALAATVVSSMAANVYSVNVVGYINVTLPPGFNMLSNPLDLDGTGTNNTFNTALANAFSDNGGNYTLAYKFANGAFTGPYYSIGGQWFSNPSLNPGEGAFVQNNTGGNVTVTFVGTVLTNQSVALPAGYNIASSPMPLTGGVGSTLQLTNLTDNDLIYTWDPVGQSYVGPDFSEGGQWFPEPTIAPGQAFFVSTQNSDTWVQSFTVQ